MALVNVHPDYIQFEDEPPSSKTYPLRHYLALLEHVRRNYGDTCWQPLPRELAAFAAPIKPTLAAPSRRVCMITHSFYESDNRVTRYAEALAARGDHVEVLALRRSPDLPTEETIKGVHLRRIQDRFGKTERSKFSYSWPWLRFLFSSSAVVTVRHIRRPYDLLHIHNIPDFLIFAAWAPRLTGTRLILDIHDIVPEFYASKFKTESSSATATALRLLERWSARFADHVIISNHLWLEKYASRTGMNGRCSVFINNVDGSVFKPSSRTRLDEKPIILFPGGLQWHQGLDIALRAFVRLSRELPAAEFHIYGDGNMKPSLVALAAELGLEGKVRFFDPVPITQIAQLVANSDLGVVPKRADSFGNEAYSTKIMEFMSVGVPVVVSKTKIDQYYFDDSVVRFFESGNPDAMASAMLEVLRDHDYRNRLKSNALAYAQRNSWANNQSDYLKIVDALIERSDSGAVRTRTIPAPNGAIGTEAEITALTK
jgi:glycosyltransferase involved in cell wall biosynthesis